MNNIFLIGFMASGKSSFGKKLAKELNINFLDLDIEIEKTESCSINEIFKLHGEPYFRKIESSVLLNIDSKNTVISVGGGTPFFHNNFQFMKNKGIVIYLELPLKVLIGRLKKDKLNRPLLNDLSDLNLIDKIKKTFYERESKYLEADLVIDASLSPFKKKKAINNFIELQKSNSQF